MTALVLGQLLSLYGWFVLTALLLLVTLIAHFYEQFSGERSHYRWYALPIILLGVAAVRYNSIDRVAFDPLGDVLAGSGALILLILILRLSHIMTSGRRGMPDSAETNG
jgi:hypothetical protein